MRSNIKYSGLGTYTKRSKNIKLGKISIAFIVTIFMLYIMFLNLRNKLVEDMAGFQEVAIVENNNINEEIKKDQMGGGTKFDGLMNTKERIHKIESILINLIKEKKKTSRTDSILSSKLYFKFLFGECTV